MTEPVLRIDARPPSHIRHVGVRDDRGIVLLPTHMIDWIAGAGDYVRIHSQGRAYLLRATIGSLAVQLDPEEFVRIHKSAIVRIDRIARLAPLFHGDYSVFLVDGTELRMSRTFRRAVRSVLAFGF